MTNFLTLPQLPSSLSSFSRLQHLDLAGTRMDCRCSTASAASNLLNALNLAGEASSVLNERSPPTSSLSLREHLSERVSVLSLGDSGSNSRRSAFIEAVREKDIERVKVLLARGKISEQEMIAAIDTAKKTGALKILELLNESLIEKATEPTDDPIDEETIDTFNQTDPEEILVPIGSLPQLCFDVIAQYSNIRSLWALKDTCSAIRQLCLNTRRLQADFTRRVLTVFNLDDEDVFSAKIKQALDLGISFVRTLSEQEMPRQAWDPRTWRRAQEINNPDLLSALVSSTNVPDFIEAREEAEGSFVGSMTAINQALAIGVPASIANIARMGMGRPSARPFAETVDLPVLAADAGNQRVVRECLSLPDMQAYINPYSLNRAFCRAVKRGDTETVRSLLETGRRYIRREQMKAALEAAHSAKYEEVIRILREDLLKHPEERSPILRLPQHLEKIV